MYDPQNMKRKCNPQKVIKNNNNTRTTKVFEGYSFFEAHCSERGMQ